MEKNKIYTLQDVANELGLDKSTVSRAISGKGRVGADTKRRVREFIASHDYRPSASAKGLATNKTNNLALVMPEDYLSKHMLFFKECLVGSVLAAKEYGYYIVNSVAESNDNYSHIRNMVNDRKVDGMILLRSVRDNKVEHILVEKKIPYVVFGRSEEPDAIWVDNDNKNASEEMTELLLMKGIYPLALIGGDSSHYVTTQRYEGFMEAHRKRNLKPVENLIFMDVTEQIRLETAAKEALQRGAECIICMDEVQAYTVSLFFRQQGVVVPGDIKLATCYDSPLNLGSTPAITAIHFDSVGLAKLACRLLLKKLGEQVTGETGSAKYQIILRESTR